MRLTGPTLHIPAALIAMALGVAALPVSAQTPEPDANVSTCAAVTEPASTAPPRESAPRKQSLMGVVMGALIEATEQSARHRRTGACQTAAAALEETRPPTSTVAVPRPDPTSVMSREDAIGKQVAVQDDPL